MVVKFTKITELEKGEWLFGKKMPEFLYRYKDDKKRGHNIAIVGPNIDCLAHRRTNKTMKFAFGIGQNLGDFGCQQVIDSWQQAMAMTFRRFIDPSIRLKVNATLAEQQKCVAASLTLAIAEGLDVDVQLAYKLGRYLDVVKQENWLTDCPQPQEFNYEVWAFLKKYNLEELYPKAFLFRDNVENFITGAALAQNIFKLEDQTELIEFLKKLLDDTLFRSFLEQNGASDKSRIIYRWLQQLVGDSNATSSLLSIETQSPDAIKLVAILASANTSYSAASLEQFKYDHKVLDSIYNQANELFCDRTLGKSTSKIVAALNLKEIDQALLSWAVRHMMKEQGFMAEKVAEVNNENNLDFARQSVLDYLGNKSPQIYLSEKSLQEAAEHAGIVEFNNYESVLTKAAAPDKWYRLPGVGEHISSINF